MASGLGSLVEEFCKKGVVFPELDDKLKSFSGWSKFFHYVRNLAQERPDDFKAFVDFSKDESGLMPSTRVVELLKSDFAGAYYLGYISAKRQISFTVFDNLKNEDYSFWNHVCFSGKGLSGLVSGMVPEKTAYERFVEDVKVMYSLGAKSYERNPRTRFSSLKTGIVAGAVAGLITLGGLAAIYLSVERKIDNARVELREDFDGRYSDAKRELETFFDSRMPLVREEAVKAFDEYVSKHPEMLYSPENTRAGVKEALSSLIKDEALMSDLGNAILKGMRGR